MWVLARAHVKPTFSPSGLAHMGPPWNPRTKLTGPHLGSPHGAHSPAHIHPLWAPHGCVDRVGVLYIFFLIMRYYTSLVFGVRLFNMPLLEIKVWICRWRHHGPGHIKPTVGRWATSDRRSGNLVYCVPRVGLMCSNKQIDPRPTQGSGTSAFVAASSLPSVCCVPGFHRLHNCR